MHTEPMTSSPTACLNIINWTLVQVFSTKNNLRFNRYGQEKHVKWLPVVLTDKMFIFDKDILMLWPEALSDKREAVTDITDGAMCTASQPQGLSVQRKIK